MQKIQEIIIELSTKYGFDSNEAIIHITNKYFQTEFNFIFEQYPKENIIESLKIFSGCDRKKHIFTKMTDWDNNEFVKYIKKNNINVEQMKTLLVQSVDSLIQIKMEKIKHKEKRDKQLIKFIEELQIGDIVDQYLIIEKCDTIAKCVYIDHKRFHSKKNEIDIHLGLNYDNNNYIKKISYKYLRNRDPYISRQSWYTLNFIVDVKNIHEFIKSFKIAHINATNKRDNGILHTILSSIKYPNPEDYPEDFNELPKFFAQNNNVNDFNKLCDILELPYEHKNNILEIKKKYKIMALKLHPDKNIGIDTTSQFQEINSAYSSLLNMNEEK